MTALKVYVYGLHLLDAGSVAYFCHEYHVEMTNFSCLYIPLDEQSANPLLEPAVCAPC